MFANKMVPFITQTSEISKATKRTSVFYLFLYPLHVTLLILNLFISIQKNNKIVSRNSEFRSREMYSDRLLSIQKLNQVKDNKQKNPPTLGD